MFEIIINKKEIKMDNTYPYLTNEDAAAAASFRATEDQFLDAIGGLKIYTQFRLDRDEARRAVIDGIPFEVPKLPQTVEEAMKYILLSDPKVSPVAVLRVLLQDQKNKVSAILSTVKARKMMEETLAGDKKERLDAVEREAKRMAPMYRDYDPDAPEPCLARARAEIKARSRR
jgi:hypothetical protein